MNIHVVRHPALRSSFRLMAGVAGKLSLLFFIYIYDYFVVSCR